MKRITFSAATLALALAPLAAYGAGIIDGTKGAEYYTVELFFSMAGNLVKVLISISTVLAACFLMYGGWLYLTSGGDAAKVAQAHKVLKNSVTGLAILLASWLIVTGIINALEGQPWLKGFFPGIAGNRVN